MSSSVDPDSSFIPVDPNRHSDFSTSISSMGLSSDVDPFEGESEASTCSSVSADSVMESNLQKAGSSKSARSAVTNYTMRMYESLRKSFRAFIEGDVPVKGPTTLTSSILPLVDSIKEGPFLRCFLKPSDTADAGRIELKMNIRTATTLLEGWLSQEDEGLKSRINENPKSKEAVDWMKSMLAECFESGNRQEAFAISQLICLLEPENPEHWEMQAYLVEGKDKKEKFEDEANRLRASPQSIASGGLEDIETPVPIAEEIPLKQEYPYELLINSDDERDDDKDTFSSKDYSYELLLQQDDGDRGPLLPKKTHNLPSNPPASKTNPVEEVEWGDFQSAVVRELPPIQEENTSLKQVVEEVFERKLPVNKEPSKYDQIVEVREDTIPVAKKALAPAALVAKGKALFSDFDPNSLTFFLLSLKSDLWENLESREVFQSTLSGLEGKIELTEEEQKLVDLDILLKACSYLEEDLRGSDRKEELETLVKNAGRESEFKRRRLPPNLQGWIRRLMLNPIDESTDKGRIIRRACTVLGIPGMDGREALEARRRELANPNRLNISDLVLSSSEERKVSAESSTQSEIESEESPLSAPPIDTSLEERNEERISPSFFQRSQEEVSPEVIPPAEVEREGSGPVSLSNESTSSTRGVGGISASDDVIYFSALDEDDQRRRLLEANSERKKPTLDQEILGAISSEKGQQVVPSGLLTAVGAFGSLVWQRCVHVVQDMIDNLTPLERFSEGEFDLPPIVSSPENITSPYDELRNFVSAMVTHFPDDIVSKVFVLRTDLWKGNPDPNNYVELKKLKEGAKALETILKKENLTKSEINDFFGSSEEPVAFRSSEELIALIRRLQNVVNFARNYPDQAEALIGLAEVLDSEKLYPIDQADMLPEEEYPDLESSAPEVKESIQDEVKAAKVLPPRDYRVDDDKYFLDVLTQKLINRLLKGVKQSLTELEVNLAKKYLSDQLAVTTEVLMNVLKEPGLSKKPGIRTEIEEFFNGSSSPYMAKALDGTSKYLFSKGDVKAARALDLSLILLSPKNPSVSDWIDAVSMSLEEKYKTVFNALVESAKKA